MKKRIDCISEEAMERLTAYDWPGNIRELSNVVERAIILAQSGTLDFAEETLLASSAAHDREPAVTLEAVERNHIEQVLNKLMA